MGEERRTRSDEGVVATVRDRLLSALRTATTPFPCGYAFLIHPRRREGEDGFGVITLHGESLPLSVAMLRTLQETPSLIDGLSPAVLGPAEPMDIAAAAERGTTWNEVLPVHQIALWPGHHAAEAASARATGSFLVAGHTGPQLVIFCAHRPEGWPA
jgi:hypothetical protein